MNDQDMIIYNYIGFGEFCLTTKLDSIVNYHIGYFSSKISAQKRSSCKAHPICIFTVNLLNLAVLIREGVNVLFLKIHVNQLPRH